MTMLSRITEVLRRARVAGGWDDEAVALAVLAEMREPSGTMKTSGFYSARFEKGATIEDAGECWQSMIDVIRHEVNESAHTSSEIGHG